ncbi:hypothetical protein [Rhodococcus sp. 24CO]
MAVVCANGFIDVDGRILEFADLIADGQTNTDIVARSVILRGRLV